MTHEGHVRRPNTPSAVQSEMAYQEWLHAEDGSGDVCPTCVGERAVDRRTREEYIAEERAEARMHDAGL